jgi:CspA family cold shock protein
MSERETGRVKWFNDKKGFGFIVSSGGDDIFVHYRDIDPENAGFKTLAEDQNVTYVLEKGPKGFKAQNVIVQD